MQTVSIQKIFEHHPELFKSLHTIVNIPIIELRNQLIISFCEHEQMKPVLKEHKLEPKYFAYVLISML